MDMLDTLTELIASLYDKGYRGFRITHSHATEGIRLCDLGTGAFELSASITQSLLLERTQGLRWIGYKEGEGHRVSLELSLSDTGKLEVKLRDGTKTDELNISGILGELKELYA